MRLNLAEIRPIAAGAGGARERLRLMSIAHAHLVMRHLPLQRVSVQGVEMHLSGSTTPEQRALLASLIGMRDEYERLFLDVLEEGIAAGEFRPCNPKVVVKLLLGAFNWMTVWYRPRPNETDESRRSIAEEVADFALQGVDNAGRNSK